MKRSNVHRHCIVMCVFIITCMLMACSAKSTLPRNMDLKAFDPHRADFTCQHEVDHVPPIDAQAEAWFQEGLRITSRDLPPNQRNYPKAVELWQQAANKNHWKAMMNLAGILIEGDGFAPYEVAADPERAVQLVEKGMQLGIPAAFDLMGSFHQNGSGVKGDISRAYAFWELAADKGSPSAQAFLGRALDASYDNPKEGFWGNRTVGRKMLECGFAQNYGKAAHELALTLNVVDKNYPRALRVLHEGVKMGSEDCASSLASTFRNIDPLTNNLIDTARSERYSALAAALYQNPDLRFPNLDKILPLPPAKLPQWDGKTESLLKAAKPVVLPAAAPAVTPGAKLSGRANIPQGWVLPRYPKHCNGAEVCSQTGIWQAVLAADHPLAALVRERQTWVEQGYAFPDPRKGWLLDLAAADIRWKLMEVA